MRWKFLSNGTGIFLAPKTGTGLSCTIYVMPVKFSLSQDMKPEIIHPNKWYRKISIVSVKNEKKVMTRKVLLFSGKFPPGLT